MKKVFAILILAVFAGAVGYLTGTDSGRKQRDGLIARVRKTTTTATDVAQGGKEVVTETVTEVVEQVSA